jgi:predicted nucleotidyltransferase
MSHIEEIKGDLETLKEIILEKVPTDQIWLFGSYAYGTPHKHSDIDIYIVMKDDAEMRELDAMDAVNYERVFRRTKRPVDVLAIKRNRFDYRAANFSMENKIKNKGVKIYG